MSEARYEFKPDWLHLVPPCEIILEDMQNIGLSQVELAKRTEYSSKHIHKLLKGEASITVDTALKLEKVLNMPVYFWMNLENNYRSALAKEVEKKILSKEKNWLKEIPSKEMFKFGWVKQITDVGEQIGEFLKFYGVSSISAWRTQQKNYQVAFKSYDKFPMDEIAIQTWLRAGEVEALKIDCQPFDKKILTQSLSELRGLTQISAPDEFIPKLQEICASFGVAVVFAPTPNKCPMSGATQWLSPHKALLMLSLRYKTNDHLWFAFFHEIGHILKHKKQLFLEQNKKDFASDMALEYEADKFASDLLIPTLENENLKVLKTQKSIKDFAKLIGIASGIVVGRLQHEKIINYSYCNDLKVKYDWIKSEHIV